MIPEYRTNYSLRTSDFDRFRHIRPETVLCLFQDAAGRHAEDMGIGYSVMEKKNLLWVVVRMKIEILKDPELFSTVTVRTWPLDPGKFTFEREYTMTDKDGELLVKGAAEWAVIDSAKRRLVPASDIYPEVSGYLSEQCFDEALFRVKIFEHKDKKAEVIPNFSDIDSNGHVNNARYCRFIMDALNPGKKDALKALQIDFNKEVLPEVPLNIYVSESRKESLIAGDDKNGVNMFTAKAEWR